MSTRIAVHSVFEVLVTGYPPVGKCAAGPAIAVPGSPSGHPSGLSVLGRALMFSPRSGAFEGKFGSTHLPSPTPLTVVRVRAPPPTTPAPGRASRKTDSGNPCLGQPLKTDKPYFLSQDSGSRSGDPLREQEPIWGGPPPAPPHERGAGGRG